MVATFAVILAAKLAGLVLTVADGPPKFNPEPGCKAAVARPVDRFGRVARLPKLHE